MIASQNTFIKIPTIILFTLTVILFVFASCAQLDESIIPYDPPGATTETRETIPQHKRIIGAGSPKVFIHNNFDGARFNDFYHIAGDTFAVVIAPENAPINNSAWYAFHITTEEARQITLRFKTENGRHRYHPKLRFHPEGEWVKADSSAYRPGPSQNTAELDLFLDEAGITVSAQELINVAEMTEWISYWDSYSYLQTGTVGYSHEGRPVPYFYLSESPDNEHLIFIFGRQHPPEVPGTLAMKAFIERMLEDDHLARNFRSVATVIGFPLMNPDGVYHGHWRHNAGGVDLNRDWRDFHQPETRAVRDHILDVMENPDARIYYGLDFHSTSYDVFFSVDRSLPSWPENFADNWLDGIRLRLPDYELRDDPFGVAPPIVKNWLYNTFQAGGVTYEVGDTTDRDLLKAVARAAAASLMEEVLEVYKNEFGGEF